MRSSWRPKDADKHDPVHALRARSPELHDFMSKQIQEAFHRALGAKATSSFVASLECEMQRMLMTMESCGADLPEATPVVLFNVAARAAHVAMVWHIEPWWPAPGKCCAHVGSVGSVTTGPEVRPIDLWVCPDSNFVHVIWGTGDADRVSVPREAMEQVAHLGGDAASNEVAAQLYIAHRVLKRRPEVLAVQNKHLH